MGIRKGRVLHIVSKIEDMNRVSVTAASVIKSAGKFYIHSYLHFHFYSLLFHKREIFTFFCYCPQAMQMYSSTRTQNITKIPV